MADGDAKDKLTDDKIKIRKPKRAEIIASKPLARIKKDSTLDFWSAKMNIARACYNQGPFVDRMMADPRIPKKHLISNTQLLSVKQATQLALVYLGSLQAVGYEMMKSEDNQTGAVAVLDLKRNIQQTLQGIFLSLFVQSEAQIQTFRESLFFNAGDASNFVADMPYPDRVPQATRVKTQAGKVKKDQDFSSDGRPSFITKTAMRQSKY